MSVAALVVAALGLVVACGLVIFAVRTPDEPRDSYRR